MSQCWGCALCAGVVWAVQDQDIVSLLPWCCFTQCKLMGARSGSQAAHVEVTDIVSYSQYILTVLLICLKDPFWSFTGSRKFRGRGFIAVACDGLEDAPSHSQGRRWPKFSPPPSLLISRKWPSFGQLEPRWKFDSDSLGTTNFWLNWLFSRNMTQFY